MNKKLLQILALLCFFSLKLDIHSAHAYTPKISTGFDHGCVLTKDGVVCWGNSLATHVPTEVTKIRADAVMGIASGSYHNCVIDGDNENSIKCFGWTANGAVLTPPILQKNVVELALGFGHTCIRKSDRSIYCWGLNDKGQINIPTVLKEEGAEAIYSGPASKHVCAKTKESNLICWGSNDFGQVQVPEQLKRKVLQAALSSKNTCVLTTENKVTCFGSNAFGENEPPNGYINSLTAGGQHLCSRSEKENTLSCWGDHSSGQATPPDINKTDSIVDIALGWAHSCALLYSRERKYEIKCWGDNIYGALNIPKFDF